MSISRLIVGTGALALSIFLAACAEEAATTTMAESTNRPPAPTAAPVVTSKGLQGSTQVKANDPDAGDTHTFIVSKDGSRGTVYMGANGMLVYIPQPDFAGVDQFEITATDSQGVTAATLVSAAVRLAPADASSAADLVTFKNTPGAYVVFAESGVPSSFQVSDAPAHGAAGIDAQGMLTYTPAEGYAGQDSIGVTIGLTNGDTTEATITVNVVNRAPVPTAAGIHTTAGTPGSSTVFGGDPDPRDALVFSIAVSPKFGTASVNGQGLVTYTPGMASGEDSFTVKVVDGSGAAATVQIDATVRVPATGGYTAEGGFPAEVCADGLDRVLVTAIDPPAQTRLSEPVTVTATLAYSLAATTTIGIKDQFDAVITSVTAAPGCGVAIVSGALLPNTGNPREVLPFPSQGQMFAYPSLSVANRLVQVGYWAETLGGPVVDYYLAFEQAANFILQVISFDFRGKTAPRADFKNSDIVLHVRQPNACDMAYRQIAYSGLTSTELKGVFSSPNLPPAVGVSQLLTQLPVTAGTTYTVNVDLEACGAPVDVTLTTSHDWFAVDATTVTLSPDGNFVLTVDGAAIDAADGIVEGVLTIHAADLSFADIEVPVSAIRIDDIDPAKYTPLWQLVVPTSKIDVALPWAFPFEGVTYPTMRLLPEGPVCGVPVGGSCQSLGAPVYGGISSYVPGYTGGPLFAPYWATLLGTHNAPNEHKSGVYYRDVSETTDPHVEFLWWDVSLPVAPDFHNVARMQLYPDGRFVYDYPSVQPIGLEVATWWYFYGNTGFEKQGIDIRSGDLYRFGPVE